jgi:hypothetical protein
MMERQLLTYHGHVQIQIGLVGTSLISSTWRKFYGHRARLVNAEKQRLDFCRRHTSSLLNPMENEAIGIEDHRG